MERIRSLPLAVLLPIVFVVVGGVYFVLGLVDGAGHINLIVRAAGSVFYAAVMTAFLGFVIARRRRKAGGARAVSAMQRTIRTGDVPDDVDTATWTAELERYRVRYRRNRWSVPVMFGVFVLLCVYLAVSVSAVWWLFLAFFIAVSAYSLWETRRALRNLDRALDELGRRPARSGQTAGETPGATWSLPAEPREPDHSTR